MALNYVLPPGRRHGLVEGFARDATVAPVESDVNKVLFENFCGIRVAAISIAGAVSLGHVGLEFR
ncbi:hypothetical protein ACFQ4P_04485 [Lacticaseibacillus mingshuiensis]|uniref:Uncharacterized protein n=1 Tax=Lacticaseibacillus mingshuiensis TaxID=2799574 RepID=A0ABW4CFD3_9LACO